MLGYEIDVNGTCTAVYRDKQKKVAHSATSVRLGIVTSEKIVFAITFLTAAECARCNAKEKCKRTSIACEKCDAALCLACFALFLKP
ncbi:hypothetical protein J6590_037436 [Homalodisca vitripennis]|nr:hypothetical protein J6590_037436 [Homalodisca vitripennis]